MTTYTSYVLGAVVVGMLIPLILKLYGGIKWYLRNRALFYKFPQSPANFLFGHFLEYPGPNEKGLEFQRDLVAKFPRTCIMWAFYLPMIIISHPDTVKGILKSSEPKGERIYNLIRPWIGDGLLTSSGKKWARNRRLLTPAFHFEILKNYMELKNRCADLLLSKFDHAVKKSEPFCVFANVTMFTLDVILRCAMSYETNCQKQGEIHPYVRAVNQVSELLVDRFFKPWLHSNFIYFLTPSGWRFKKQCNFMHKVAEEIIAKRRETIKKEGLPPVNSTEKNRRILDFLDILLTAQDENGVGLTSAEIRDEVDTFLFEGHDTTASAISWALYSIAEHQDIQKRIQDELDERLAGRKSDDILSEDLSELPYLTMVIKEALRIHTPVPFIQRELTSDTEIDGHLTPAGYPVNIILYDNHHNPEVWEDSMKFDPDRFLPENVEKRSAYAFIPFSAGSRNCIGQNFAMHEIKVALGRILQRYNLKLDPNFKVEKAESIVMRSQQDIRLLVTERPTAK